MCLFAEKMLFARKICCTTYKNICTYGKKAVPLRREKINQDNVIYDNCMAGCNNPHIINLLHSGKFTIVNLTQSKLAKCLHLKIDAKVIKKTNTNKLNYKIMKNWQELREQVHRIMLNCKNVHRGNKGYIYYTIGGKKYKRSDLMQLATDVAQKRYKLSRFKISTNIYI